jgi:Na+/melibiose symporter-like transporter
MGIVFTLFVYLSSWDPIHVSEERRNIILADLKDRRKKVESPLKIIIKNFANLWLTLRIKTFRKHLVLFFSTFGVIDSYTTIFVIFASVSFLPILTIDPSAAGVILAVPLLVMTFAYSPLGAWLLNHPKIGPSKLYLVGFSTVLLACVTYGITYFSRGALGASMVWVFVIVAHCIFTIGRQIMGGIPWVVFPMMADIDEVISRDKRAGIFAGAMTFVRKFTNAVFNILIGVVMSIAGYNQAVSQTADKISSYVSKNKGSSVNDAYHSIVQDPNIQNQIQSAGFGITLLMVFFVGGLLVWALWNAATFKLNYTTHDILIAEIKRLRKVGLDSEEKISDAKKKVDPKTKKVIEQLTGLNYEKFAWSGDVVRGDSSVQLKKRG